MCVFSDSLLCRCLSNQILVHIVGSESFFYGSKKLDLTLVVLAEEDIVAGFHDILDVESTSVASIGTNLVDILDHFLVKEFLLTF